MLVMWNATTWFMLRTTNPSTSSQSELLTGDDSRRRAPHVARLFCIYMWIAAVLYNTTRTEIIYYLPSLTWCEDIQLKYANVDDVTLFQNLVVLCIIRMIHVYSTRYLIVKLIWTSNFPHLIKIVRSIPSWCWIANFKLNTAKFTKQL